MSKLTLSRLIFEPHNGYGSLGPDGEPWPFGYEGQAIAKARAAIAKAEGRADG